MWLKAINSAFIQVTNEEEAERAIVKENTARFKFAYSSLMLGAELHEYLGRVDKGKLHQEILYSKNNWVINLKCKRFSIYFRTFNARRSQQRLLQNSG